MNARVLAADSDGPLAAALASYVGEADRAEALDRATTRTVAIDGAPEPERLASALAAASLFARTHGGRVIAIGSAAAFAAALARAGASDVRAALAEIVRACEALARPPRVLHAHGRELALDRACVMGILNVTPDSFHDGGRYQGVDAARARASAIVASGAAIVDIGGRSYSAANAAVTPDEEIARVVPVVEALVADGLDAMLSVDTTHASVARAALAAGAHVINDCSGLADPELARVVAAEGAALVVMHLRGRLNERAAAYPYDDALGEIATFLRDRLDAARAAGVAAASLVADPGLEFGKEPATDLSILARFGELRSLGVLLLLAASRKSFLGRLFERPAAELLVPSLAAAAAGIAGGAAILRAHDVAETADLARLLGALAGAV